MSRRENATTFLNVDLDVWSRAALKPLAEAFDGLTMFCGRAKGLHRASFEARTARADLDGTVRALVRAVRRLQGRPLALWQGATRRDFNIGLQGGSHPRPAEFAIEATTLQSVAAVAGRIVITVYAPEDATPP